jgi:hypothetical protein
MQNLPIHQRIQLAVITSKNTHESEREVKETEASICVYNQISSTITASGDSIDTDKTGVGGSTDICRQSKSLRSTPAVISTCNWPTVERQQLKSRAEHDVFQT